jgi:hypothetical protein
MYDMTPRWIVVGLLAVSPAVLAQQSPAPTTPPPTAPTREVPRPEELEPGVNTSVAPAPEAPGARDSSGVASSPGAPAQNTGAASAPAPKAAKSSSATKPSPATAPAAAPTAAPNSGAHGGKAEDHLQLDTTQITGNQELPKVLYIVPWKRSDLGDLLGKPANSLLDEVLQPVDRDVFKRENRYYDALKPDAASGADKAAGAAGQGSGDKH